MATLETVHAKIDEFLQEFGAWVHGAVEAAAPVQAAVAPLEGAAAPLVAEAEKVVEDVTAPAAEAEAAQEAAAPAATPEPGFKYLVVNDGDTLQSLAASKDLSNATGDLYDPNMDTIESAARAAGHPSSNGGEILIPGTVLKYR